MVRKCKWPGCITILSFNPGPCCLTHQPKWVEKQQRRLDHVVGRMAALKHRMPTMSGITKLRKRLNRALKDRTHLKANKAKYYRLKDLRDRIKGGY